MSSEKANSGPSLWRRAVGWDGVMGYIGVFSTQYLHQLGQTPKNEFALATFSAVGCIVLQPLVGVVVVGGIVVGF